MDNEYSDVSGEKLDPEWFKWAIHKQGWSIRRLGADRDIGKTDKTIRRAVKAERIRPELLDRIARKLDVYPPYLAGRYAWTLKLSIMDEEGVCDYWRDTYLDPKHFVSLCFANSIEDVLRNYFLRFAAYQNVVLRCLVLKREGDVAVEDARDVGIVFERSIRELVHSRRYSLQSATC